MSDEPVVRVDITFRFYENKILQVSKLCIDGIVPNFMIKTAPVKTGMSEFSYLKTLVAHSALFVNIPNIPEKHRAEYTKLVIAIGKILDSEAVSSVESYIS